jgi:CRISPR-associated protein Csh1
MQDKAIIEIGKLQIAAMQGKKPYEFFIQNMFPDKDNYNMILAVFNLETVAGKLSCKFDKITIENVSKSTYTKYAYRKGSSRGGDITFTTKFGDIDKKFRTLVDNQFKSLIDILKKSNLADEFLILNCVYEFLAKSENFSIVKNNLSSDYEKQSKEEKMTSGLSMLFIVDGKDYYLENFAAIQQIIYANGTEEKSEKYGVKSEGNNAVCSICLNKKEKLHGFASPFKYATVDKPGMVSGFFEQKNNWKNYPICSDCSLAFEMGRSYITSNLSGYFYGNAFYMIPKTLISKDTKHLKMAITKLKDIYDDLNTEGGQKIRQKEDRLWELVAANEDYFNLNLLFHEENPTTKAIKIKLLLEEIVPSRFRKLFVEVPSTINKHPLYKNVFKKEPVDLRFSLGVLKTFFEDDFYDLIQRVFLLQKFSKDALYKKFMSVIRANYNKSQTSDGYVEITQITILKAHLTLRYFQNLELINYNSKFKLMDTIEIKDEAKEVKTGFDVNKLKIFVEENQEMLDSPSKVGLFSLGVLVKLLMNKQQRELSNTPFEKKLKGYNLNADSLKKIHVEVVEKLKSYYKSSYIYTDLREFVAQHFMLNINKINNMTNNEVSFYFVAGLEFCNQFKNKNEE